MKTNLNHDQIAMSIERARNERSLAVGRWIASAMHTLLDWMEKGSQTQPQPAAQTGYHLNSEGRHPKAFDTSAFV
ncbi:MAG: hypothetical protein AW10_02037 [Candidatus Accumulibacter appositus]|uniref:Uncharacterized protein n=1 Tax=Candidatus Accumulibacter appositus TaxID=1454003 RepID=A0A011QMI5_9PROT|nr:hypothetical protein [Accumulibacter sp.]EXI80069.1 MAG: hypothetical protein AW10_02037 [Candidatus Accumulibacter appositus]HRF06193.1 hypothetical protein [Accumulibacter sp.]